MARVTLIKPRLSATPPRVKPSVREIPSYGQGRGGRPWRRLRDQAMARDQHMCQPCKTVGRITEATEVDHILNLAEGGTDELSNLQAICQECHKAKTLEESKRAKRRY